jgi:hypothetical protein
MLLNVDQLTIYGQVPAICWKRVSKVKEVMVRRDGKQAEISPYDWIYVKDGLPHIENSTSPRRACYVCFNNGKTAKAFYTGSVMDTWLSQDDTHIALNENEIVAWRYQAPA